MMQKATLKDIGEISLITSHPEAARRTLLLAHGAGAGMEHGFLSALSGELAGSGFRVIRFNFPYKEQGKKMPGSPKEAILCWRRMVEYAQANFPNEPLFISGKSYGGRMASHLLAEVPALNVNGIIYFGFPLHPPGKPSTKRASHLDKIQAPQLFLQGTKDKLADITLIREVTRSLSNSTLIVFDGADHSFKVWKSAGLTTSDMIGRLAKEVSTFSASL